MDIESEFVDNIKACRTCGIHYVTPSKHQLKRLFQSGQEHSEVNLIRAELSQWNIEVVENDGFPQYVCNACIHKFEQVFQLRAACINAQNEFRKFYAVPNGNMPAVKIKTELLEPDEVPPSCDFIYVDELSDTEYDGTTPFNIPHVPIKEEVIEAATIPMEESEQPMNFVESASRVVAQKEPSSYITDFVGQTEAVVTSQPNTVMQIGSNEVLCNVCQYVSSNQEEHLQHMRSTHGTADLECHICGKEFKNSTTARLKFHMKWHTLNKRTKCTLCGFLCNSKEVLTEHKRLNHRKINCKVCGKGILAKKMKSHLHQHDLNTKYSCEYCTQAFTTEIDRENHIWDIHAKEDNACNSSAQLQTNLLNNADNFFDMKQDENLFADAQEHAFKFMCAHCEHRFINQFDLETHVNHEHRPHFATVEPHIAPPVEAAGNNDTSEMAQNKERSEQDSIAVFEEYDDEIRTAPSDSLVNGSETAQQDLSSPTCSTNYVNERENEQCGTTATNSSSYEQFVGEESQNEANINLSPYVESNFKTFACAKCAETFVSIEQLRQHHERHLLADQSKEMTISPTKLKFQCHLCVKSFDLKFRLNRHIKKHKCAPF